MSRNLPVVFAVALLMGVLLLPEATAQAVIHAHPGWLTTGEGFDVASGWPEGEGDCCWGVGQALIGDYTTGTEPDGQVGQSAFWNPNQMYPGDHSYLWVMGEGATLETLYPIPVTEGMPWLFVQFLGSDMNDGLAEIDVKPQGSSDWITVGGYDTFGRGNNWASVEGLPLGSYYVRITSRWSGRRAVAPNGGCGPAVSLQPARMGSTAAVPPESLHLTGGGWLSIEGGKTSFSMDITFTGGSDRPSGFFTYVDHVLRRSLQSTQLLGIEVIGGEAWIRLAALSNYGTNHTIYAHLLEGAASVGKIDMNISREWTPCTGVPWIYRQSLTLGRGQIKIH